MPILDLRLRKAVRHIGARLVIASERPTALDGGAEETARYAPGDGADFLAALAAELGRGRRRRESPHARRRREARGRAAPGHDRDRLGRAARPRPRGDDGARRAARAARRARLLTPTAPACSGSPTAPTPAACARSAACPAAGPGFAAVAGRPQTRGDQARRSTDGELDGVILLRRRPGPRPARRPRAGRRRWPRADFVLAISCFEDASTKAADVVFPAEAYAEKEGTVTHPDGRLQRLRPASRTPASVRPIWQVARRARRAPRPRDRDRLGARGARRDRRRGPLLRRAHPEEIGGSGVRWQDRAAGLRRAATPDRRISGARPRPPPDRGGPSRPNGGLRLGTYRDLWAGEVTERNAALRFLAPEQTLELALADAERLGLGDGDEVEVRSNGTQRQGAGRAARAHAARRRRS